MDSVWDFACNNAVIIVLFFALIIILPRLKKLKDRTSKHHSQNDSKEIPAKRRYTLDDCTSVDDLKLQADAYQRSIETALRKYEKTIKDAQRNGYIKSSIAWTEQSEKLSRVSNILYSNLKHENSKRLVQNRFHRYTNLHFRSMLLDHIAYQDYSAAKKVRDEIGQTIILVKKRSIHVTKAEKEQLYSIKDACVNTTRLLYDRMISIQNQTRMLKLKIRDECGATGRAWFEKIEKNKQRR